MTLQRYDIRLGYDDWDTEAAPDGEFCTSSDVAKLEAELRVARGVLIEQRSPEWADQAIACDLATERADKLEARVEGLVEALESTYLMAMGSCECAIVNAEIVNAEHEGDCRLRLAVTALRADGGEV